MHSKRKIKDSVSTLKDENNKFSASPGESANLLAEFFSSTFVKEPFGPLSEDCYISNNNNPITELEITVEKVKKLLSSVNSQKLVVQTVFILNFCGLCLKTIHLLVL